MKVYVFSLVELSLGDRSKIRLENPDAGGAFVNCLALGNDLQVAEENLRSALNEDGYQIIAIGDAVAIEDYEKAGGRTEEFAAIANGLSAESAVYYFNFHVYPRSN